MTQQENIKRGDVVRLKSGGPRMTVVGPGKNVDPDQVYCTWFGVDFLGQPTRILQLFYKDTLRKVRVKKKETT